MKMYYLSAKQITLIVAVVVVFGFIVLHFMGKGIFNTGPSNKGVGSDVQGVMLARGEMLLASADTAIAAADSALAAAEEVKETIVSSPKKDELWAAASAETPAPSIRLSEKITAYEAIQVNPHPDAYPTTGDQVVLSMLGGQKITVNVESMTTHPNGDYSWSGHVQGYGDDYPVAMTYGERATFATITTPQGAYSMESVNGSGWVYKNPAIVELSAPGTKDFIEVENAR
jgi:hypothetical protein